MRINKMSYNHKGIHPKREMGLLSEWICRCIKTWAGWICCANLLYQSVFQACFPFFSPDLHPEAPGQDSVLHRARDCWERSSLAVCPRGKANTYLGVSLLCPFFMPRPGPKPQPLCRDWSPCLSFCLERSHVFSTFTQTQVLRLCPDNAAHTLKTHQTPELKSSDIESSQAFILFCSWRMDEAALIRFQRKLVCWPLTWFRDKGKPIWCMSEMLLLAFKWTSICVLHPHMFPDNAEDRPQMSTVHSSLVVHVMLFQRSRVPGLVGVRPDRAWQGIVPHGCSQELHHKYIWSSCAMICCFSEFIFPHFSDPLPQSTCVFYEFLEAMNTLPQSVAEQGPVIYQWLLSCGRSGTFE